MKASDALSGKNGPESVFWGRGDSPSLENVPIDEWTTLMTLALCIKLMEKETARKRERRTLASEVLHSRLTLDGSRRMRKEKVKGYRKSSGRSRKARKPLTRLSE